MRPYPFDPSILDALPEELAELYRGLEDTLLTEICSWLTAADQLNEVTVQDIRALRSHGIDLEEIEKAIRKTTGISEKKLNKLLDDVVERNQRYYTEVIDLACVTQPDVLVDAATIDAIRRQTQDVFRNITASMGFLVDDGRTMLPPAKGYQWALNSAALQIESGAISYNQAIKNAVTELANSGLKTVEYESGHRDQIDVAARRAVMTGVSQLCAKYTEQAAEYLETPYYEVSAHSGARDKPGRSPWSSHRSWQGRVYSIRSGDIYPNIYSVCGLGAVDGLEGANCRHRRFPWVEGVSERTYTDEQLAHIDDGLGCTFEGKTYTAYEASQQQRKLERTIRKQKRLVNSYKAAGLTDDATTANIKLNRLNAKYKEFSKAAGLPEQLERLKVLYGEDANQILRSGKSGVTVHTIGKIDIEKYSAVSTNIRSDEVVITDERIQHIKDRHPNDYERYSRYIGEMLSQPQYILEDNVPNTAVILQEFAERDENFRLILKLAVVGDAAHKKNSVITFLKVSKKKFDKYIRNKKILYKSE